MRDFFNSVRFKVIVAVLAVITGIMLYAASTGGLATIPEKLLSYVVIPVQKLSAAVSDGFTDFFSVFFDSKKNYNENVLLKEELTRLRNELIDYETIKTENERLREILELKKLNPDIQLQDAGIIARDATDRFGAFTIDKGSIHGLSRWDPVITGDGMVGYIDSVGTTYSKVVTILSPEVNLGAVEIQSKETGNVTGTVALAEEEKTKLELLPKTTEIEVGDLIITAGSSGYCPAGLIIGTVESIKLEESGITMSAVIKPSNTISEIKHVFVLTDFLGKQSVEGQP